MCVLYFTSYGARMQPRTYAINQSSSLHFLGNMKIARRSELSVVSISYGLQDNYLVVGVNGIIILNVVYW